MLADILRILLVLILPPLGVFLQEGIGARFWLNVILTLCGWLPGLLHGLYVIVVH